MIKFEDNRAGTTGPYTQTLKTQFNDNISRSSLDDIRKRRRFSPFDEDYEQTIFSKGDLTLSRAEKQKFNRFDERSLSRTEQKMMPEFQTKLSNQSNHPNNVQFEQCHQCLGPLRNNAYDEKGYFHSCIKHLAQLVYKKADLQICESFRDSLDFIE